jgi:hypothetical protein
MYDWKMAQNEVGYQFFICHSYTISLSELLIYHDGLPWNLSN